MHLAPDILANGVLHRLVVRQAAVRAAAIGVELGLPVGMIDREPLQRGLRCRESEPGLVRTSVLGERNDIHGLTGSFRNMRVLILSKPTQQRQRCAVPDAAKNTYDRGDVLACAKVIKIS